MKMAFTWELIKGQGFSLEKKTTKEHDNKSN
jgi:hypothetical protein